MADVNATIAQQQTWATSRLADVTTFLGYLESVMAEPQLVIFGLPDPQYVQRYLSSSTTITSLASRPATPTFADPSATKPTFTDPTFTDPSSVNLTVPDFNVNAPVVALPTVPSTLLPTAPTAPTIQDPDYPSMPTYALPTAPTLSSIQIPTAPTVNLPVFSAQLPVDDLVAPSFNFTWAEQAYQSALLDSLKAKLLNDLENGGYGIEPDDEERLWNKARDRETVAGLQAFDQLAAQQAARGFAFPPGDMLVAQQRAAKEQLEKISSINRDIMVKRGDLYVENRQFVMQQSRELETVLLNYWGAVQERALNAQRVVLQATIEIFNALVSRYNARLEAYRSSAQVFESQVRAEISKLEMYRTQMEGARVQAEVNRSLIDNYRAQVDAVTATLQIYRTAMEAAQVKANVERTRIEAFRAQIDAYAQQVQAKVAEFEMYKATISGETAKVQAYEAQVRGYAALVDGFKAKAQVRAEALRTEVEQARTKVEVYKGQLEAYSTDLRAQLAVITANIEKYRAQTGMYQVDLNYFSEWQRLNAQLARFEVEERLGNMQVAQKNAEIALQAYVTSRQLKNAAAGLTGQYFGQLAAAAASSINTLVTAAST